MVAEAEKQWKSSTYWLNVKALLSQLDGMLEGIRQGCPGTTAERKNSISYLPNLHERPMLIHLLLLNANGDLYQIAAKFDQEKAPPSIQDDLYSYVDDNDDLLLSVNLSSPVIATDDGTTGDDGNVIETSGHPESVEMLPLHHHQQEQDLDGYRYHVVPQDKRSSGSNDRPAIFHEQEREHQQGQRQQQKRRVRLHARTRSREPGMPEGIGINHCSVLIKVIPYTHLYLVVRTIIHTLSDSFSLSRTLFCHTPTHKYLLHNQFLSLCSQPHPTHSPIHLHLLMIHTNTSLTHPLTPLTCFKPTHHLLTHLLVLYDTQRLHLLTHLLFLYDTYQNSTFSPTYFFYFIQKTHSIKLIKLISEQHAISHSRFSPTSVTYFSGTILGTIFSAPALEYSSVIPSQFSSMRTNRRA